MRDADCAVPPKQDRGVGALVGAAGFVSDDDSLVLEDECARMALRGPGIAPGPLVTGVVAAVRGTSAPNGEFLVKVSAHRHHVTPIALFASHWTLCLSWRSHHCSSSMVASTRAEHVRHDIHAWPRMAPGFCRYSPCTADSLK